MSHSRFLNLAVTALVLTVSASALAQPPAGRRADAGPLPFIEEKTAGMKKLDGFFPLYWDERSGQLWMEISRFNTEVLHSTGYGAGLGSNDIGIDRGALAGSRIVSFERVGAKILMVAPNYRFRSVTSTEPASVRGVRDAFARSVLWGFQAAAETGGRVLVDVTEFLVRDALNVSQRLRPGAYRLDPTRSAIYLPMTQNFPKNTEMEAELTFAIQPGAAGPAAGGGGGGGFGAPPALGAGAFFEGVRSVAAVAEAATVRVHQSLVELPDGNYKPRAWDPRSGFGDLTFLDYTAPLGASQEVRYLRRHRLQKVDPKAKISDPVKPITYYLDPGAPEPIRSALLGGCTLVEPGVRGRRLPQRVPRGAAARGRQSARHPLQRDQLGASLDARLEHGRLGDRSAHRRDHQGRRHARLAAHPPGLHAGGGHPVAVQDRHGNAAGAEGVGARPHPPACGARGGPHARIRPPVLRQHGGPHLGDGLPAPARDAEGRRHVRLLEGVRRGHRRVGQGCRDVRLPGLPRRHGRGEGARGAARRRLETRSHLPDQPGHRGEPARRPVVERHRPGGRAHAHDGDPPRGALALRRERHQGGRAAGEDGRGVPAALPLPSLPGRGGSVGARRPALHLRDARRRARAATSGRRPPSNARRSRRCSTRSSPRRSCCPSRCSSACRPGRMATT